VTQTQSLTQISKRINTMNVKILRFFKMKTNQLKLKINWLKELRRNQIFKL